jgi:hypothetical protein
MPTKYADRLQLPINGCDEIVFLTIIGLDIATGYNKIVYHKSQPYIEFSKNMIHMENVYVPENQKWRIDGSFSSYVEYRSKDCCKIKILQYKKKLNLFYISPFDLKSDKIPILINPLRRKKTIENK